MKEEWHPFTVRRKRETEEVSRATVKEQVVHKRWSN